MRLPLPAFLVAATLCGSISPVLASGWSATGFFRQNFGLTLESEGGNDDLPTSSTSLGVTFANQTPTLGFSISPGVVLSVADRQDQNADTVNLNPRLSASLSYNAPRFSLNGSASVVPQFRSERQFDSVFVEDPDTGEIDTVTETRNVDPLEIASLARLGASYRLSPRTSVNTSAFVRRVDFSGDSGTLEPSTTVGASAGLSRSLDSRTSGSFSVTARRFMSESAAESDRNSFSFGFGGSRQLSPRLNAGLNVGLTGVDGDDGFDFGFSGGLSGGYRFFDARLSGGLSQSVDQNADGAVESVTAARAGIDYPVNQRASVGLSAAYTRSQPFADSDAPVTDALTVGARFGYRFTAAWGMSASYGLRAENEDGQDPELSHRFGVSFSRNFTF